MTTGKRPRTVTARPEAPAPATRNGGARLPDRQTMLDLLRKMLLIRRFEEPLTRIYRAGDIGGYMHLYIGQEAIAAGILPLLEPGDIVLGAYRDHGYALTVGAEPRAVMAELFGKASGVARGKGGSMHLVDAKHGFLGAFGIVGGSVPLSVGAAFALKYRGEPNVCVTLFGDGAMEQGVVHESLNMAALYGVPCLFVLENNLYAMGTSVERHSSQPDFVRRVAEGYRIDAERVDGMDVLAVRSAAHRILQEMRATGKPFFLEAECYRFEGHGAADNEQQQVLYRDEAEKQRWRKRDPIAALTNLLLRTGSATRAEIDEIDAECRRLVGDAITFAGSSPFPPASSVFEDVYTDLCEEPAE